VGFGPCFGPKSGVSDPIRSQKWGFGPVSDPKSGVSDPIWDPKRGSFRHFLPKVGRI